MNKEAFWEAVTYGAALRDNVGFDIQRRQRQEEDRRSERWLAAGLILATLAGSYIYTGLGF